MVRLATAAILLAARCLSPVIRRVRVEGLSMVPAYAPGEYVWALRRVLSPRKLRVGDVVVCRDPAFPERELIKRVSEIQGKGDLGVVLSGDNREASRDSRDFGAVPSHQIMWIVFPNRRPL